jgi:hypothetical protein
MSNLKIEIPSEDLGWIVSLLKRGLMEHQTSYGDSIPVPKEVIEFIKNLSEESAKLDLGIN